MSTLKVNKIRDTAGSADSITLDPNGGAVIAGVTTVSTVKVGSGVTITSDGDIFHTGVCTATSFVGDAANLTKIPAANIVGVCTSGLTKTGGFGKILQVVQGYDTSFTRAATSSGTYVATTHSVTITPTQANSKILITFSGDANNNGSGNYLMITVQRSVNGGSYSDISELGQSGGNSNGFMIVNGSSSRIEVPFCINFLDSPSYSVGNAIVYKLYFKGSTGGGNLEIPSSGDNQPVIGIAQEIAA